MGKKEPIYQFDLSKPYIVGKNKLIFVLYIAFFAFSANRWFLEKNEGAALFALAFLTLAIVFYWNRKNLIQINTESITGKNIGTIYWKEISYCDYIIRRSWSLNIVMKDGRCHEINLDEYDFNAKRLAAAINCYAGCKMFNPVPLDNKTKLIITLIGLATVASILCISILLKDVN